MKNYKEKIKEKGLKMVWIAEKCGVTKTALSNYFSGIRTMPVEVENKLKQLLK